MPTYEYVCRSCGEHLEVVQSFSDAALTDCPACVGVLRKVFQPIGISFKGSGFYKNDSRASSSSSNGGGGKGTESKPSTSDTKASSDAKASDPGSSPSTPSTSSGKSSSAAAS